MSIAPMSISRNLKRLRQAADMTQTALSKRSGVDQGMISKIESGEITNLTLDMMRKLTKPLGCSVVDLLPEEDKRGSRNRPEDLSIEALAARIRALEARFEYKETA
jgi:transcriptional regulator with XRE-family HTH domain